MITEVFIKDEWIEKRTAEIAPFICKHCSKKYTERSYCYDCLVQVDGPTLYEIEPLLLPDDTLEFSMADRK